MEPNQSYVKASLYNRFPGGEQAEAQTETQPLEWSWLLVFPKENSWTISRQQNFRKFRNIIILKGFGEK